MSSSSYTGTQDGLCGQVEPIDSSHNQLSLSVAKESIQSSIEALEQGKSRLGSAFVEAVQRLASHEGKILVCGLGKSGYAAKKTAASLCSIGKPAFFLNPIEALHGDLGVYKKGDPTILFSRSGSTAELLRLIPLLKQLGSPLIAISGNAHSPLAKQADIFLDASISREGDPLGLLPSSSIILSLALADALIAALIQQHNFQDKDFALFHPAGQLGRNLLHKVQDTMYPTHQVACVLPEANVKDTIIAMTHKPLGAACVVDTSQKLLGLVTDGDLRRALLAYEDIKALCARDIMSVRPLTIEGGCLLGEALKRMESPTRQLSVLPVVNAEHTLLGLLRLHDIYQPHL